MKSSGVQLDRRIACGCSVRLLRLFVSHPCSAFFHHRSRFFLSIISSPPRSLLIFSLQQPHTNQGSEPGFACTMKLRCCSSTNLALLATIFVSFTLLAASVKAKHDSHARTHHLLRCLGHHAVQAADIAKVQALLDANPNPTDDAVWSQLNPKQWGFKGHDAPGGDTWQPENGAAQTAKERTMRQHAKLLKCAKRLHAVQAPAPPPAMDAVAPDQAQPDSAQPRGMY